MKVKTQTILFVLFALTVIGIQLQDVLTVFTPMLNKAMGMMMAAVLMFILIEDKDCLYRVFNREIVLWLVFLIWSGLTGVFVARHISAFIDMLFYLAQQTLIVMAAILISVKNGSVNRVLYIIFLVPLIFIIYLFGSGKSNYILSITTGYESNYLGELLNANTIAFWNLGGIIAYAIFRPLLRKKSAKIFCLLAAILYGYIIIQSGSRKTFLAVILFIVLAYLFNRIFVEKNSVMKIIGILAFFIVSHIFVFYVLPEFLTDTYLGQRLMNFTHDSSNDKRVEMITEALKYFTQSPIWGIGINQFQFYTAYGYYSHCDIAEVLCSTGIVGGLLYISIYILCYRKLFRIWIKYRNNSDASCKQVGIILAGLTAMVAISIGSVAFESLSHWLMLSVFIGYTQINNKEKCRQGKASVINESMAKL